MKEIFGVIAGVALMVGCCLLPLVLLGAGSASIAGILAWIGGLDPLLGIGAVIAVLLVIGVIRLRKGDDRRRGPALDRSRSTG